MGSKLIKQVTSAVVLSGLLLASRQTWASSITDFNLLVTGNAKITNSHIDGTTAIGGNLIAKTANFAQKLDPAAYTSVKTLLVGGQASGSLIDLHAGVFSYGSLKAGTTLQPSSITTVKAPFNVTSYSTLLQQWSDSFKNMNTNSALNTSGNPAFNATPSTAGGVAVFNVNGSIFSNSAYQNGWNFNLGTASTLVINVTGSTVNFSTGNFNTVGFVNDIIWNFVDATSIDLSNMGGTFQGTILAPKATLTIRNRQINGNVYTHDLIASSAEFHLNPYQGFNPLNSSDPGVDASPIPLPSALPLGGIGLLILVGQRAWNSRRRTEL